MASPHLIELDKAVSRIKQACDGCHSPSPFFFMVGAGISFPSVPLAAEIVSRCKEKAAEFGRDDEPPTSDPIDLYSHWFENAYGDAGQRQRYLRELIEDKPITQANLRLAHLLLDDTVSNIVVTTNFDDFLTKALTLFGKRHVVCDHPQTVGRIHHAETDLQIVHLHGTHWFYDCCNLRGELQSRASLSEQTTWTMASLLDNILWDRSPLVLGYSGWEGDVFMSALKRRLTQPLRNNAYWFCFDRDQIESLPDWLKHNSHLRFVVPSEAPTKVAGEVQVDDRMAVSSRINKTFAAVERSGYVLPADRVLDKLIRAFKLQAPILTSDPLGFFAGQLEGSLPKDEASDKDDDIYAIKSVIQRVQKAKELIDFESSPADLNSLIEVMRDGMRRADYRQVVNVATKVDLNGLSLNELHDLGMAAWSAATRLYDNSDEELAAYDLVVAIYDKISAIKGKLERPELARAAEALFNKSSTLWTLNRSEQAMAVCDEMVRRYGNGGGFEVRIPLANALLTKGISLGALGRGEEAMATYEDVVRRFDNTLLRELQKVVADALNGLGFELIIAAKALLLKGDQAAAKATLERAEVHIKNVLTRQPHSPVALGNAGYVAFLLDRTDEARALLTEAIRFGGKQFRDAELGDATINRLPEDDKFIELINSIPLPPEPE